MRDTAFYHIAEHPMHAKDVAGEFYRDSNPELSSRFLQLNGLAKDKTIMPGRMLLVPSRHDLSSSNLDKAGAFLSSSRQQIGLISPGSSTLMNQSNALIGWFAKADNQREMGGKLIDAVSNGASYIESRANLVNNTLKKVNAAYVDQLTKNGKLSAPEFKASMAPLMKNLQGQLNGMSRKAIVADPAATNVRNLLGISHKRALNDFKVEGKGLQVREISKAMGTMSKIASNAQKVGNVVQLVNLGVSARKVYSEFDSKGVRVGADTLGRESASLLGGTLGGLAGSSMAVGAITMVVGTGGMALPVIAAGLVGGVLAGSIGSELGEAGWDTFSGPVTEAVGSAISWFAEEYY